METVPGSQSISKNLIVIVTATVIVLVVVALIWYFVFREPPAPPVLETPASSPITSPDLGSEVFEKASNPLSGKLPESTAPVPNPIEDVYRNPFQ